MEMIHSTRRLSALVKLMMLPFAVGPLGKMMILLSTVER
jgi:hypothetical protein